jgi:preprotein translocase subunit SecY
VKDRNWRKPLAFIGAIAFIEIGARVALLGVDIVALARYLGTTHRSFLVLAYTYIAGGGLFRAGSLALGFMPYVAARIYMRLWRTVRPDASLVGERTRVRWLTGALAVVQSLGFATYLQRLPGVVPNPGAGFTAMTMLTLTAGSLIAMWFGEKLTDADDHDDGDDESALRPEITSGNFAHAPESTAARPQPDAIRR